MNAGPSWVKNGLRRPGCVESMPRFKLTVEFDGTPFVGWQRQANGPSVQEAIETAAEAYCQTKSVVHGAGRTDAGVHAKGLVAHVDLPRNDTGEKVRDALNAHLRPFPIAILQAEEVSEDFHARFSALKRHYLYRLSLRRAPLALEVNRAWRLGRQLDCEAMTEAGQVLIGKHDFTSFRASECQAPSPIKTLDEISVFRVEDMIHIEVKAKSFLHHQVRNIVGTLVLVGDGKWTDKDVADALAAKDRKAGGPTAPPEGLYLMRVLYPD